MLRTDSDDYRRSSEAELLRALAERDALALAETYHRTVPGAHAVARRLLAGSVEIESLLREVYLQLWTAPPTDAPLEGWLRGRAFALATEHLRERSLPPASPTAADLLPELPRAEPRYLDAAERAVLDLDPEERLALLRAHDAGEPAAAQGEGAAAALDRALLALAGPDPSGGKVEEGTLGPLGDYVLGLLPPRQAEDLTERIADSPADAALVRGLRRGRRRLEGLPPTPDLGQRVLVSVLVAAPAARAGAPTDHDAEPEPEVIEVRRAPSAPTSALDEVAEDAAVPSGAVAVAPDAADVDLLDEAAPSRPRDGGDAGSLRSALDAGEAADAEQGLPPAFAGPGEEGPSPARTSPFDAEAPEAAEARGVDDDPWRGLDRAEEAPADDAEPLDVHDERSGDLLVDPEQFGEDRQRRGAGATVLRLLGYLLLLALGSVVGLFIGQFLVNRF